MTAKTIILFIVLQLLNVILHTVRSILTVKGSKLVASISSAVAYGLYSVVTVIMVQNIDLWLVVVVTVVTNLIGTYFSKWLLERLKKDDLWEVVATVSNLDADRLKHKLKDNQIECYYVVLDNGTAIVHIYSKTQKDSEFIKMTVNDMGGHCVAHTMDVQL